MNRFRIVPGSRVQVAHIGRDNLAEQKTVAYISGGIKHILGTHNFILLVFGGKNRCVRPRCFSQRLVRAFPHCDGDLRAVHPRCGNLPATQKIAARGTAATASVRYGYISYMLLRHPLPDTFEGKLRSGDGHLFFYFKDEPSGEDNLFKTAQ